MIDDILETRKTDRNKNGLALLIIPSDNHAGKINTGRMGICNNSVMKSLFSGIIHPNRIQHDFGCLIRTQRDSIPPRFNHI
jgi:hypothetical protein